MRLWGGDGAGACVVRARGAAGCGGVRGAVGYVARAGCDGACSARCGGVRGVVRGRAGGAPARVDRSSRVGDRAVSLAELDAWRVIPL